MRAGVSSVALRRDVLLSSFGRISNCFGPFSKGSLLRRTLSGACLESERLLALEGTKTGADLPSGVSRNCECEQTPDSRFRSTPLLAAGKSARAVEVSHLGSLQAWYRLYPSAQVSFNFSPVYLQFGATTSILVAAGCPGMVPLATSADRRPSQACCVLDHKVELPEG